MGTFYAKDGDPELRTIHQTGSRALRIFRIAATMTLEVFSMGFKQVSLPDTQTAELAANAATTLRAHLKAHPSASANLQLGPAGSETRVVVPEAAFTLLVALLEELALGHTVTMASIQEELSTQQAADLLNVSRPYLVGLLEEGKIPFRRVGNRRRLSLADLLEFKREDAARREKIADRLTAEAQDMGLYQ